MKYMYLKQLDLHIPVFFLIFKKSQEWGWDRGVIAQKCACTVILLGQLPESILLWWLEYRSAEMPAACDCLGNVRVLVTVYRMQLYTVYQVPTLENICEKCWVFPLILKIPLLGQLWNKVNQIRVPTYPFAFISAIVFLKCVLRTTQSLKWLTTHHTPMSLCYICESESRHLLLALWAKQELSFCKTVDLCYLAVSTALLSCKWHCLDLAAQGFARLISTSVQRS